MSTIQQSSDRALPFSSDDDGSREFREGVNEFRDSVVRFLKPLASLKLSVVMFALGIFLVLAGTLAQVEKDIWEVVSGYFRCWFAWVEFQVFFPKTWVPELHERIGGGFWFPGGWLIGGIMTLNLLAAHALRFKVQAKGQKLFWGLSIIAAGLVLCWAVIEFGTARNAVYETASFSAEWYWNFLSYGLLVPAIGCGIAASMSSGKKDKTTDFVTYGILSLGFLATALYLIVGGESVRLDNSSMRILWQLIQATFAGAVLLGGCLLLFKKRAGIVLLHAGVLLLMSNELVVHSLHEEANIILSEGETTDFARDIRTYELAVLDRSESEFDTQTVVPAEVLQQAMRNNALVTHPDLPVDFRIREFYANAELKPLEDDEKPTATTGIGTQYKINSLRKSSGTDSNADYPAAFVDVIDKQNGNTLETLLVSAQVASIDKNEKITVAEQPYEVALRFKRNYKPYSIHLIDVRKDDYIGTTTPMNYSSDIRLVDPTRNEDRQIRIWMNNPLRFAGETFYQSGYQEVAGKEVTTLQVVTNEGWMIPYLACMIVVIGMFYQFAVSLLRFLDRLISGRISTSEQSAANRTSGVRIQKPKTGLTYIIPAALAGLCAYWLYGLAQPPRVEPGEMNLYAFGQIPVAYEGRVKPLDTLARNSLRILSNRETIKPEPEYATNEDASGSNGAEVESDESAEESKDDSSSKPAILWLLQLASGAPEAFEHPIIRIDNDEVLSTLKLERRKSHRYSLSEIQPNIEPLINAIAEARKLDDTNPEALSVYQRKVLELERKLGLVDTLTRSFMSPPIDPTRGNVSEQMKFAISEVNRLDERKPPLLVPPVAKNTEELEEALQRNDWETYSKAFLLDILYSGAFQKDANPFSEKFAEIIMSYQDDDAQAFNENVADYRQLVKQSKLDELSLDDLAYEARFNSFSPFFWPGFIYIFAFVLAVVSWLLPAGTITLNRSALAMIAVTFVVHSMALYARVQISGRPPVTNLYSSAVFIGWAAVLFGMVMELVFKRGIGNVMASAAGFASLWIAHGLAGDGDTFVVLQAVLDTQFWLSTHVVLITLGYAATFVAGLLGVIYIARRNPFSVLAVGGAVGAAVALQNSESVPLLVRNVGPFLLAIPFSIIPLYILFGAPQIKQSAVMEKNLARMIYGTLCFALLFSFFGTVLGGLWADDSWGRFWGWDPKENGALIIVLWNALILHAHWDKMIRERGLALLAVAGNITTAWSWFGVNELGVGLHSYGFTEGVLFNLMLFVFSQLALIVIGAWGSPKAGDDLARAPRSKPTV